MSSWSHCHYQIQTESVGYCTDIMWADVLPELDLEVEEVLADVLDTIKDMALQEVELPASAVEDTRQVVEEQHAAALVEAVEMVMTIFKDRCSFTNYNVYTYNCNYALALGYNLKDS